MSALRLLSRSTPRPVPPPSGGRPRAHALTPPPRAGGEGGCGCGGSAPAGGCGDKQQNPAAAAAAQPAAAEPTTAAALTAFAAALGNSDGTVPRAAMDAIAAPLRRGAASGEVDASSTPSATTGERVVTVAELLAFDPDDPDNDLDKYIV